MSKGTTVKKNESEGGGEDDTIIAPSTKRRAMVLGNMFIAKHINDLHGLDDAVPRQTMSFKCIPDTRSSS